MLRNSRLKKQRLLFGDKAYLGFRKSLASSRTVDDRVDFILNRESEIATLQMNEAKNLGEIQSLKETIKYCCLYFKIFQNKELLKRPIVMN